MNNSLTSLLSTLQSSLESASLSSKTDILPPQHGISLLDLKNELFLSYLQNLVFLILVKLRHSTQEAEKPGAESDSIELSAQVTRKLVELRLYIEKGVKPLEGKLKYQIDKVVKTAEDVTRSEKSKSQNGTNGTHKKKEKKKRRADESEDSERSSASESEEDDAASASSSEIDELSYRPNPAAMMRREAYQAQHKGATEPSDGIYRPPRITATSMPTTRGKEEKTEKRPNKSATLDEFIADEMSTAPTAEPSIGSTIVSGGRRVKSQRERDDDANRTRYEEENLIRLPAQSKKEKAKQARRDRGGVAGEDLSGLGLGLDRIDALVQRKAGSGGKVERSKKRSFESSGMSGADIGRNFEKRKKSVMRRFR